MSLIVEDGSIVVNANSYVDLVYIRAYASARGVSLSGTDSVVEEQSFRAMDYLESKRTEYQGSKVDPSNQELQFPRYPVYIDCNYLVPSDEIPKELKNAQCQLIIEAHNGVDLQPTRDKAFVTRQKVDKIEREFSETVGTMTSPTLTAVDALLQPLFNACGQGFPLRTVRI